MNCRPGDLAVVVKTGPLSRNCLGAVVQVHSVDRRDGFWTYSPRLKYVTGEYIRFVEDCCLRPIRDNDGTDETLTWAGLPNKQDKRVTA